MSYADLMNFAGLVAGTIFGIFVGRWLESRGSLERRLNAVEEQLASQNEEQAPPSDRQSGDWRTAVMG